MIFGVLSSIAQTTVPNSDFENWSIVNSIEVPDNWYIRQVYNPEDEVFYGYSKTSDKYSGNYALKLYNTVSGIPGNTIYGMIHTLPPNHQEEIQPAFPVSIRHTTLNGYYKYTPSNGDSCQFIVWMYKHGYVNSLTQNILGGGWATKKASPTYVPFTLDINYYDSENTIPDSACISLSAFKMYNFSNGTKTWPLGNSELIVDNISFDGFVTGINTIHNLIKEVTIFPNPASSVLTINMLLDKSIYHVSLYDLLGRLVKTFADKILAGEQQLTVNIEDIPTGNYLLVISTKDGYYSNKVVIK
jgi:hypothetical protein